MTLLRKLDLSEFPACIQEIPQPPKQLWLEGELPSHDEYVYLAVVGSRRHSTYGEEATRTLIAGLKGKPVVIVSGLALGIDALAHRAAIAAGLKTIAIPGSGLDRSVLYPSTNRALAEEIVSHGGALLSEFDPTFRATPYSFPKRNRIMAGLSKAILVVEAHERSGTLITARLATEYNRDVLVVPGPIFSPNSLGNHMLARLGATPVATSDEILDALGLTPNTTRSLPLDTLTPAELAIMNMLESPLPRDVLLEEAGLSPADGNVLLMTMELKGLIKESAGAFHRQI